MGNTASLDKDEQPSPQLSLLQFKLMGIVGRGAFGKVRIVEHKTTKKQYALKYISKSQIVKADSAKNIIRERRILEKLRHPFICNLRYSFQDTDYLYIVVDLMTGGDLRFHLTRRTFSEAAIRFWIAELACALDYIHARDIVHRDVKPENILLDANGHVCLADFNVASHIRRRNGDTDTPRTSLEGFDMSSANALHGRSGTMAYLAPEVYTNDGYGAACDWWSLGVVLYECIYSRRPFPAGPQDELIAQIKQAAPKYYFTSPPVSHEAEHAIQSLLCHNPATRLGATGMLRFFDEPFFSIYTKRGLEDKEYAPVFEPSKDRVNFDAAYELEELLFEDTPLEARGGLHKKRRPPAKNDASAEKLREVEIHRMIESLFESYDHTAIKTPTPSRANRHPAPSSAFPHSRLKTPAPEPHSATRAQQPAKEDTQMIEAYLTTTTTTTTSSSSSSSDSSHDSPRSSPSSASSADTTTGMQELKSIIGQNLSPIPQYYEFKRTLPPPSAPASVHLYQHYHDPHSRTPAQIAQHNLRLNSHRKYHDRLLQTKKDQWPKFLETGILGKEGSRVILKD